jgi:hypothetical protein
MLLQHKIPCAPHQLAYFRAARLLSLAAAASVFSSFLSPCRSCDCCLAQQQNHRFFVIVVVFSSSSYCFFLPLPIVSPKRAHDGCAGCAGVYLQPCFVVGF